MMDEIPDEELIRQFEIDRDTGFRAIYQRYSGPLLRFTYRFTGNQERAEEILHEVFSELLEDRFLSGPHSSLKSWLFAVAKNKGLNHVSKRRHEVSDEKQVSRAVTETNPESLAVENDLHQRLAMVEEGLAHDLRQTWALRKEGLDYQEISEKLSIPIGTVKSRFFRLVEFLKKEFEGEA